MTTRREVVNSLEYDFTPDDRPPAGRRWWALATAQLIDEITEQPVRVPFTVRLGTLERPLRGITAKPGPDGTFCLVARPHVRFPPAPGPRPVVRTRITAPGYLPRFVSFTLPFDVLTVAAAVAAGATVVQVSSALTLGVGQMLVLGSGTQEEFGRIAAIGGGNLVTLTEPLRFPHAAGDPLLAGTGAPSRIRMRRTPVTLRGRVSRRGAAGMPNTPVAGVTITLADFWRTRAEVAAMVPGHMTKPPPRMFALALAQGILEPRPVNSPAGRLTIPLVAGDDKRLIRAALPEQDRVWLSNRVNVVATRTLRIEAGDAEASEIHTVSAVTGLGGVDDPAQITTDLPLLRPHAPDVRIDRLAPTAAALPLRLTVSAAIGDRTVLLDALPALPAEALRVRSAGSPDELHDCAVYAVTSDAQGYFRLPPMHRIAEARLDADDGVTVTQFFIAPEYGETEQWLDLVIP